MYLYYPIATRLLIEAPLTYVTTQSVSCVWRIVIFFWLGEGKVLQVLSWSLVGVIVSGCVFIVIVSSLPVVFGYQTILRMYICSVS